MTKLKTLKDIECGYYDIDVDRTILKKEAVEWIKELKFRESYMIDKGTPKSEYWENTLLNTKDFIIYFFNLTEEDLK